MITALIILLVVGLAVLFWQNQQSVKRLDAIVETLRKVETYTKDAKPRQSTIGIHKAPLVKPQIERPKQVGPRHRELRGASQRKAKRVLKGGEFT